MAKIKGEVKSLGIVRKRRRKSSGDNENFNPRVCEGQRKEKNDLKKKRRKMKMVPGRVSGGGSTEDMAPPIKRLQGNKAVSC